MNGRAAQRAAKRFAKHNWLRAGLLTMGYTLEAASLIASRYCQGHTLFPNEMRDVERVANQLKDQS